MYYTKYRPQKFSEISKPNETAVALMNQVKSGKTSHAYLFVGPRGTGKTTTARILAKALNCEKPTKDGDPCLKCEQCQSISAGRYIDLIEIDAASNRGIDDIRELKDKIKLSPSAGTTKVYIIDEVHMLTPEAFNALLKTLEEPPVHAVFILCTTELHKVPDTIKSRCQLYKFKRATKTQLVERLQNIAKSEGVTNLTKEDFEKIADASFGGFRDAETVLQQVVEGNLDPTSFVGLSSKQVYVDFVDHLINNRTKEALSLINKLDEDGMDFSVWSLGLLNYLRDLLFIKLSPGGSFEVPEEILKSIQQQSSKVETRFLSMSLQKFLEASNSVNDSVIPQLPIELAVVDLCEGFLDQSEFNTPADSGDGPAVVSSKSKVNLKSDIPTAKNKASSTMSKSTEENTKPNKTGSDINENNESDSDRLEEEELLELSKMFEDEDATDDDVTLSISNELEAEVAEMVEKGIMELTEITDNWTKVVKESVQFNNSIHALLKASTPVGVIGNNLYVEVSYKFHKDRLESPKNRKIVEGVLKTVFNEDFNIYCKINPEKRPKRKLGENEVGELTDHNVAPAMLKNMDNPDSVLDFFDGGLPM